MTVAPAKKTYTKLIALLCIFQCTLAFAQIDSSLTLTFDFNDQKIEEKNQKIKIKPVGISLTKDRFGNEESAIYTHGHSVSYLNLGTSKLLKPRNATISLWVNLDRRIYAGKGYELNPIIVTKNAPGHDFIVAYGICYDCYSKRFGATCTKDSTEERIVNAVNTTQFGNWYHLVFTFSDTHIAFYVNGKLQQEFPKNFETKYLESDSVVVGNFASTKNDRFSQGSFDDIQIFHRVLNAQEVKELYEAPDPNIWNPVLKWVKIILGVAALIWLIFYIITKRYQKAFEKEKERNDLINQIFEMEVKVIKAQMNPHFMFNSLNSIQHLILANDNDKAYLYLVKFSKLLRKLLESNTSDTILLKDEIDLLTRYLEIESLRFEDVFLYEFKIDEKLKIDDLKIPHMLIQPFVENAIWHGILHKSGSKKLLIEFKYIDDKTLLCIVDDDGAGRKIKSEPLNSLTERKSFAMDFIKQRLQLIGKTKGVKCGFEIIDKMDDNNVSSGTTVKITMPIIKEEEFTAAAK